MNVFRIDTTLCEIWESVGFVLPNVGYWILLLTSDSEQYWKNIYLKDLRIRKTQETKDNGFSGKRFKKRSMTANLTITSVSEVGIVFKRNLKTTVSQKDNQTTFGSLKKQNAMKSYS